MNVAPHSLSSTRVEEFKVSVLFGALFPVFFVAVAIARMLPLSMERAASRKSAIGETLENMSIAISYALTGRAMLQSFARDNRAERLSRLCSRDISAA